MKLLRVNVISAKTCAGLLDSLEVWLRSPRSFESAYSTFDPLCLVGPNGAGKSQFLQVLAEMFQSVFHACLPTEERIEGNQELQFELEYLISPDLETPPTRVLITRKATGKRRPVLIIQREVNGVWESCALDHPGTHQLLPRKVVGYTSGDNETLSIPFFISRGGYANSVTEAALFSNVRDQNILDTRLMLIDYGTNLEVLVSNLLMGNKIERESLLDHANLKDLHSFRCVIQLTGKSRPVELTDELKKYIENLRRCATCYEVDSNSKTYTFDYWVNNHTRTAFKTFWSSTLELYSAFHKLAMLNDLAIRRKSRDRFRKSPKSRGFAARLPEPQDEDKVFRFERVSFVPKYGNESVDYVSLSDGEHQLGQLLGTFCMLSFPNVLFILDEPESHFNPQWRVQFVSRLKKMSTRDGSRLGDTNASLQDCLLTTHSPFVPSDMRREKVFIFRKKGKEGEVTVVHPEIETYGATFDTIVEECFDIRPPISDIPREEIDKLKESDNIDEIKAGLKKLGYSTEKALLADRVRQLAKKGDENRG